MRKRYFGGWCMLLLLLLIPFARLQASQDFTKNIGQLIGTDGQPRPDVKYYTRGKGAAVFLREDAISYVFTSKTAATITTGTNGNSVQILDTASQQAYRIDMELIDAHIGNPIIEQNQQASYSNYYLAHCLNGITNVPNFEKVIFQEIYDGIDLVCYHLNDDFKYDFILQPGADPNQIKLRFVGADAAIRDDGSLLVTSDYGELLQAAPATFEDDGNGNHSPVGNQYIIDGNGIITFRVDNYDPDKILVIDPLVLNWSTYINSLSTGLNEHGLSIDHDSNNNIYTLITTSGALNFPITPGLLTYRSSLDYAVLKRNVNTSNNIYTWITYFGGSQNEGDFGLNYDFFSRLKLNSSNEVIITGTTKSNDLLVLGPQQTTLGTSFVAKFNENGMLQWSTYYGDGTTSGSFSSTIISGLACKANGEIAITGSYSGNTPVSLVSPLFGAYSQSTKVSTENFISKFSATGNWQWGTLFGGSNLEGYAPGIVFTANGDLIVAGETSSTDLPGKGTSVPAGGNDIFVAKFKGTDYSLAGTVYYGGNLPEYFADIVSDLQGNIYITGGTSSLNLPGTSNAFQTTLENSSQNQHDIFILKMKPDACSHYLVDWATYYGGSNTFEYSNSIRIGNNRLYITGTTPSGNFPITSQSFEIPQNNINNFFAIAMEPGTGLRQWGICYGGTNEDLGSDLTIIGNQLYFIGASNSANLQTTGQTAYVGNVDVLLFNLIDIPEFTVKLIPVGNTPLNLCSGDFGGETLFAQVHGSPASGPLTYSWTYNGQPVTPTGIPELLDANLEGKYIVTVTDALGRQASDAYQFKFFPSPELTMNIVHIPNCITEVTVAVANFQAGHTYSVCIRQGRGLVGCFDITNANPYNISELLPATLADGTYTVIVTDNQSCLSCESRETFTIGQTVIAQTLGQANLLMTINANGGIREFKGTYIVEGPLELTNGEFKLLPGTRFYVKGNQGVDAALMGVHAFSAYETNPQTGLPLTYNPVIIKVKDAKITMDGATLTTLCGTTDKWGGIYLTDKGFVTTNEGQPVLTPTTMRPTEISNACIGIGSAQLSGGGALAVNLNYYDIANTRFVNNVYGFRDERKLYPAVLGEGIYGSTFLNCGTGVFWDNEGASGLGYGGNYSAAVFEKNQFLENERGFVANDASNLTLKENTFTNNSTVGLIVAARQNLAATVTQNTFTIPGGATGMYTTSSVTIQGNILNGNANAANSLGLEEAGTYAALITENTFQSLETAVKIGNNLYDGVRIESNTFTDNVNGITFSASNISNTAPRIRCNSFQAPTFTGTSRGIFIPQNVRITASGPTQVLGSGVNPNGNRFFNSVSQPVINSNTTVSLDYFYYTGAAEEIQPSQISGGTRQPGKAFTSGDCGSPNMPGVQSRSSSSFKVANTTLKPHAELLGQNFPNPVSGETVIPYHLPEGCQTAAILIREIISGKIVSKYPLKLNKGAGQLNIDLSSLNNGLYLYVLVTDKKEQATKMLSIDK